jgi:hypothetical protein
VLDGNTSLILTLLRIHYMFWTNGRVLSGIAPISVAYRVHTWRRERVRDYGVGVLAQKDLPEPVGSPLAGSRETVPHPTRRRSFPRPRLAVQNEGDPIAAEMIRPTSQRSPVSCPRADLAFDGSRHDRACHPANPTPTMTTQRLELANELVVSR